MTELPPPPFQPGERPFCAVHLEWSLRDKALKYFTLPLWMALTLMLAGMVLVGLQDSGFVCGNEPPLEASLFGLFSHGFVFLVSALCAAFAALRALSQYQQRPLILVALALAGAWAGLNAIVTVSLAFVFDHHSFQAYQAQIHQSGFFRGPSWDLAHPPIFSWRDVLAVFGVLICVYLPTTFLAMRRLRALKAQGQLQGGFEPTSGTGAK